MKVINEYNKIILDTYYPGGVKVNGNIEISSSKIVLNIMENMINRRLDDLTGGKLEKTKSTIEMGKFTSAAISLMINDAVVEILTMFNGDKDTIESFKNKRDSAEEKALQNMRKEARVILYGVMLGLTEISYAMETKSGMEHNLSNLADRNMYRYKLASDCIDLVLDNAKEIIKTPEGEILRDITTGVKESLMEEWNESKVKSQKYGVNEIGSFTYSVNTKVGVIAIEEGIKSLELFIDTEMELYCNLKNFYLYEREEFDDGTCYKIEGFLEELYSEIYKTIDLTYESISILLKKKEVIEKYLN